MKSMITHELTHVPTPPADQHDIKLWNTKITHDFVHEVGQKANGLDIKKFNWWFVQLFAHESISLSQQQIMSGGESNYSDEKSMQEDVDDLSIGGYESGVQST